MQTTGHPMRASALTVFQPRGTDLRIVLLTGRQARGRVGWVRLDGAVGVDEAVATATAHAVGRSSVAVITGSPAMDDAAVRAVLANCLAAAGFETLAAGDEVSWTAPAVAAE